MVTQQAGFQVRIPSKVYLIVKPVSVHHTANLKLSLSMPRTPMSMSLGYGYGSMQKSI